MNDNMDVPYLKDALLSQSLGTLVEKAKALFEEKLAPQLAKDANATPCNLAWISVAPGRVNLIGEHTDYTGGFVLPFAIDYSTVIYGTGQVAVVHSEQGDDSDSGNARLIRLRFVSTKTGKSDAAAIVDYTLTPLSKPPEAGSSPSWTWYVIGTVAQYLQDVLSMPAAAQQTVRVDLNFAIAGDVPLGSGLSSSASLEVAVARFVEVILGDSCVYSLERAAEAATVTSGTDADAINNNNTNNVPKWRALRCQKAENDWCHSPCGIMDQYVSSAATPGSLLLIDCRSLDYQPVTLPDGDDDDANAVALVVANSNVKHDIAGGEYPIRVAQCKAATKALREHCKQCAAGATGVSTCCQHIQLLRDATLENVLEARDKMDEVSFRRARHVVTENARTLACQKAMQEGDYVTAGQLMYQSHVSMRDDYEVSCPEIDVLVELAMSIKPGVFGSRLTGGGFGGCTVTLVQRNKVDELLQLLQTEYPKQQPQTDGSLHCDCFVVTRPGPGARLLAKDGI